MQAAMEGIGERRAEGFGEIALNPPLLLASMSSAPPPSHTAAPLAVTGPLRQSDSHDAWAFGRRVEIEAWRRVVQDVVWRKAMDASVRSVHLGLKVQGPPPSQIAGLRRAFLSMLATGQSAPVRSWLQRLQTREADNRKVGWDAAARETMRRLAEDADEIWRVLELSPLALPDLTQGGGANARAQLRVEAVVSFVEACIHVHARSAERPADVAGAPTPVRESLG
jgi:CRISPR-associated protein Csx10